MSTGKTFLAAEKQKGLALLVLLLVVVLAAVSYSFSGLSINQVKLDKKKQTTQALQEAKEALIAYAVTGWFDAGRAGKIGKLPCPDYHIDGIEGEQDGNCGKAYANGIGFFPWRTLGMAAPNDGSGNCFIYAVSPAYKASPQAALNPDSYGQIQIVDAAGNVVSGNNAEDRLMAVIISPGDTLSGQTRSFDSNTICGDDYANITAYLDNDGTTNNAAVETNVNNVIDQLVQSYPGSKDLALPLNDRIVTITHREIWGALESTVRSAEFETRMKNLTEALAICFSNYAINNTNHLPMPAAVNLSEYRQDVSYDDSGDFTTNYAGRMPYDVKRANDQLGNGEHNFIFKINADIDDAYCDEIDLESTAGTENINFSDNGEYFDLWSNWKDHFFYAISKPYNPSSTSTSCSGDCITVNGAAGVKEYAAIVFYSGLKRDGQQRYTDLFDAAQVAGGNGKDNVENYLEPPNFDKLINAGGNEAYEPVDADNSNDVMFCINTDMSVEECL